MKKVIQDYPHLLHGGDYNPEQWLDCPQVLEEDVRLMKSIVGNKIKVKAAGGIRTLEDALAMLEAGAERLGTSAGVRIIESLQSLNHEKYMEVEEHER